MRLFISPFFAPTPIDRPPSPRAATFTLRWSRTDQRAPTGFEEYGRFGSAEHYARARAGGAGPAALRWRLAPPVFNGDYVLVDDESGEVLVSFALSDELAPEGAVARVSA